MVSLEKDIIIIGADESIISSLETFNRLNVPEDGTKILLIADNSIGIGAFIIIEEPIMNLLVKSFLNKIAYLGNFLTNIPSARQPQKFPRDKKIPHQLKRLKMPPPANKKKINPRHRGMICR